MALFVSPWPTRSGADPGRIEGCWPCCKWEKEREGIGGKREDAAVAARGLAIEFERPKAPVEARAGSSLISHRKRSLSELRLPRVACTTVSCPFRDRPRPRTTTRAAVESRLAPPPHMASSLAGNTSATLPADETTSALTLSPVSRVVLQRAPARASGRARTRPNMVRLPHSSRTSSLVGRAYSTRATFQKHALIAFHRGSSPTLSLRTRQPSRSRRLSTSASRCEVPILHRPTRPTSPLPLRPSPSDPRGQLRDLRPHRGARARPDTSRSPARTPPPSRLNPSCRPTPTRAKGQPSSEPVVPIQQCPR